MSVQFFRFVEISRRGGCSTRQPQRTDPCQCVSGQPRAYHGVLQGQMHSVQCAAGVVKPALEATARLGRWFVGGVRFCRFAEISRGGGSTRQTQCTEPCQCMSGLPWGCQCALQDAAFVVCSRCYEACDGGCSRTGQDVCGACSFVGLWRFLEEEAALGNHNPQSPASV